MCGCVGVWVVEGGGGGMYVFCQRNYATGSSLHVMMLRNSLQLTQYAQKCMWLHDCLTKIQFPFIIA
jgi:hypothetical protein